MTDTGQLQQHDVIDEETSIPLIEEATAKPAPLDERQKRKRQQRLDARNWVPSESVAVIHRDIEIGSQTLQKQWNLLFVRAQVAMYMLQSVIPSAGTMEQARIVDDMLSQRLDELENELEIAQAQLREVAKADGIEFIPAKSFSTIEEIRVPIYTPAAGRYLRLMINVDQLYWEAEFLWLQGSIKLEHKWQLINLWRKRLWEMVDFTTKTWLRARKSLRETQQLRNDKQALRRAKGDGKADAPGDGGGMESANADAQPGADSGESVTGEIEAAELSVA